MSKLKRDFYCTCGDNGHVEVEGASAESKLEKVQQVWDQVHAGEGHAPCDKATAAKARRRADRLDRLNPPARAGEGEK